jgi:hypothetical protein
VLVLIEHMNHFMMFQDRMLNEKSQAVLPLKSYSDDSVQLNTL